MKNRQEALERAKHYGGVTGLVGGIGSLGGILMDEAINTEVDHAGSEINAVRRSYDNNPEHAKAQRYTYSKEKGLSPMDQRQIAEAIGGGDERTLNYLAAEHPNVLKRIQEVQTKRPDLIPLNKYNAELLHA